ncbi:MULTISPECIES: hypothetical protein [Rhodococcus]|uniref:hypothetical protein n=1 Tax=Rhodococcus TaxID=1827 RepID=UPI0007AEB08E|nr:MULTISPECIES: hypothetical protein [Rhodococcus]KZL33190.1 hypothetical protein A3852_12905 [Rhodococcus qingshengii]MCE4161653.1 hypothetical protein [Rhodococcus sp. Ni2]
MSIVVNNLPDPPSDAFLTQPLATLAAGVLAIVAASIAFLGVVYTQRRTARATRAQLRLQSVLALRQQRQHEAQLEATAELERSKHRRQVEYEALSAALPAVMDARDAIIQLLGRIDERDPQSPLRGGTTPDLRTHAGRLESAQQAVDDVTAKGAALLLIGQETAYLQVMEFSNVCRKAMTDGFQFDIQKFAGVTTNAIGAIRDGYKP